MALVTEFNMDMPLPKIEASWLNEIKDNFNQPYMLNLGKFLISEHEMGHQIYPPSDKLFSALNTTPFSKVRVVILGQDPYHGPGQAHGLSFSVPQGVKPPPSLINIFKEIQDDLGAANFTIPCHGDLTKWAEQGVLLLNTVLTVRANSPLSHRNQGWEIFTDNIIQLLNAKKSGLIFVLWGSPAKAKAKLIDSTKHTILTSAHPSPLSSYRGFFGCKHFSKINQQLQRQNSPIIDWFL